MTRGRIILLSVFVLLMACSVGIYKAFHPVSMGRLESNLQASYPELQFESRVTLSMGAWLLDFVDFAFVHQPELDVSKISHAEVGFFKLAGQSGINNSLLPEVVFDSNICPAWEVIVRVRETDNHVDIAVCTNQETIAAISIFVLEPEQMLAANARGDFDGILESLVKAATES